MILARHAFAAIGPGPGEEVGSRQTGYGGRRFLSRAPPGSAEARGTERCSPV